jgi:nucleotide-binding universal stress UspA family protein
MSQSGVTVSGDDDEAGVPHPGRFGNFIGGHAIGHEASGLEAAQVFLADGSPASVIAAEVKSSGIDLLVMGAYGHSQIREFFVGSTTTKLLRNTPVSVLMFR